MIILIRVPTYLIFAECQSGGLTVTSQETSTNSSFKVETLSMWIASRKEQDQMNSITQTKNKILCKDSILIVSILDGMTLDQDVILFMGNKIQ